VWIDAHVVVELKSFFPLLSKTERSSGISPNHRSYAGTKDPLGALIRKRQCYFDGKFVESPIYDGLKLEAGNTILGNAIIEEATTTTVIPAGNVCMVDDYGNYIVVRKVQ
jgi:N-methylhydantoinase A/oxoprolinase/acetone carboxylase beta subunit